MIPLLLKYWKIAVIFLLLVFLAIGINLFLNQRAELKRISANLENITALNDRQLTLNKKEYNDLNSAWKAKFEQTMKENDIKLKSVRSATITITQYKDTGTTKIIYKDIITKPDGSFKIPVESNNGCWGMKGNILSVDPSAKLEITERTANNSIQRIEVSRRFLGFLWYTKKSKIRVFTECGEADISTIDFIK